MTRPELTATELDEEHEQHGTLLGKLWRALAAKPPALETAQHLLAELASDLPEHTLREEAELLPWLARLVPSCAAEIDGLLAEHVTLVQGVTGLRKALHGQPDAETVAAALRFVEDFRRHVDRERQLTSLAVEVARSGAA